jgi:uncharacterized protein YndB with AHSA1/START domain/DNA-binding transcriptional ArsR family regulator
MVNSLDEIFSSLSDPTRRDMLQRLLGGALSVNQLAEAYDMSLPAVSKHLKVLEAARLITKERRGRQQVVRLADNTFQNATDHLLHYQTVLDKRLDSLGRYLQHEAMARPYDKTPPPRQQPTSQTLVMTHIFNASPQQVWDAYTDPEHISKWWGPPQTTVLGCYNDVRVGGLWRFAFRGAEGQDYVVSGSYQEVKVPERLVYTDGFGEPDSARPEALVTIAFEELPNGQTKLTKTSVAPPTTHQLQAAWLKAAQGLLEDSTVAD